ncbi:hypothetical protein [Marinomonas sp. GJ51-6]|uniref:hypothetical protein n=1 Tax=Marinomonas sp. GJ51-6 TaxID=2992802 RepID=UPI0029353356|nr:hypothetical protein [Marinomonas sp. GJ51-6]WOD08885.1 hypothetical protein ONZ50_07500 [Marinomonas sp. GJ51-6]
MRFLTLLILLFSSLISLPSYALEEPSHRVVLTVSGAINVTNVNQEAAFDMTMLQALPQYVVTTKNPWTKAAHTYQGFSAIDLLNSLSNKGNLLQVTALNKYMTEIPLSDFAEQGAIFATHQDGVPMSVRNLGPIMVIYPFDANEDLRSELYYSRSIWQVSSIKTLTVAE